MQLPGAFQFMWLRTIFIVFGKGCDQLRAWPHDLVESIPLDLPAHRADIQLLLPLPK